MKKWILGAVGLLAVAGLLLIFDGDALARASALRADNAETRTAKLEWHTDHNLHGSKGNKSDHRASFTDPDTDASIDCCFEAVGMGGLEGRTLRKHSGEEVTVYLYDDDVVAVRMPDGDLIKGKDVGLRGIALRWGWAVLALGIVLFIISTFFNVEGPDDVGMAYFAIGGVRIVFLLWTWVALVVVALVACVILWFLFGEALRARLRRPQGGHA